MPRKLLLCGLSLMLSGCFAGVTANMGYSMAAAKVNAAKTGCAHGDKSSCDRYQRDIDNCDAARAQSSGAAMALTLGATESRLCQQLMANGVLAQNSTPLK